MTLSIQPVTEQAPVALAAERVVCSTRFLTLYDDDVLFSDGKPGRHHRLIQSGGRPGVAVLPYCRGRIALVRVWRYPIAAWEWGIPRGSAHSDSAAMSAAGELTEELGEEPETLQPLGIVYPDSGLLAGAVHLFAARYAEPVSVPLDTREVAAVRWEPVRDLLAAIAAGEITDGFTLAVTCQALVRGLITFSPPRVR